MFGELPVHRGGVYDYSVSEKFCGGFCNLVIFKVSKYKKETIFILAPYISSYASVIMILLLNYSYQYLYFREQEFDRYIKT